MADSKKRSRRSKSRRSRRSKSRRSKSRRSSPCVLEGVVYRKEKYNHGKSDIRGSYVYRCGKKLYVVKARRGAKETVRSPRKSWERYVGKYWD
jgi:hypothetical protein